MMLNRLGGILLGGGYLATIWYAMEQGFIRRKGIPIEEYAMLAGLIGIGWLVLTLIAGAGARKLSNTQKGLGNLNGLTLGVLMILVMLPLQLLYGPRHQTGTPFALDQMTYLAMVAIAWFFLIDLFRMGLRRLARTDRGFGITAAGVATVSLFIFVGFLTRTIMEEGGASIGEGAETPAKALTMAMGMSLLIGVALTFLLDLPRSLWLRRKSAVTETAEPEPVSKSARENRRVAMPANAVGVRKEVQDRNRKAPATASTVIRN